MKTKIWRVTFGSVISTKCVVAKNINEAIKKATSKRNKDWAFQNMKDITEITLEAESKY